jgi:hypothetical protein
LRKYLIAAVAALTALCFTAVAMAQFPDPAPKLTIKKATPKNAGTKSNPKPARLNLLVKNNEASKTTMDTLTLYLPKTWKVSGAGLPKCDYIDLATNGRSVCPAGSAAGKGKAHAILGPYLATPSPLVFDVYVYNGGKKLILFYLDQDGGNVETALKGTVKKASGKYGYRISIKVPDGKGEYAQFPNIQQPVPNVYSALVDLSANIYLKKGTKSLLSSIGCKGGKYPFKATLRYSDNPTPPGKRTASSTTSKSCTK